MLVVQVRPRRSEKISIDTQSAGTTTAAEVAWQEWHRGREHRVVQPQGNLALIETIYFNEGEDINSQDWLAGRPDTVQITEIERHDFSGNLVAKGIRLWDSNSDAIQNFTHIDTFPYDPAWVLTGTFTKHDSFQPVAFEHIRDNGGSRDLAVPGDIDIDIAGEHYTLQAFYDEGPSILVFADPTNGKETYGAGRFLYVDFVPDSDQVILDFNRAWVPPCGYSIHYNCPLPPQQNRIAVPVRAGEKNPVFANGFELH